MKILDENESETPYIPKIKRRNNIVSATRNTFTHKAELENKYLQIYVNDRFWFPI